MATQYINCEIAIRGHRVAATKLPSIDINGKLVKSLKLHIPTVKSAKSVLGWVDSGVGIGMFWGGGDSSD